MKNGSISNSELFKIRQDATNCFWCKESLESKIIHIDHYIPLSKGGTHSVDNIVISCSTCNLKKSDKMPDVFIASLTV